MAKASWADQSFKKTDRKKYADGGAVDLSSSSYADNSGGTWGEMGARALDKRRDDDATDSINRTTSASVAEYDDKSDLTDSFKSKSDDSDTVAKENAGFDYKPEPVKAAPVATKAATPDTTNADQVSRTASREAKKESFGDQVSRKMDRAKRAFTGDLTAKEKTEASKGIRDAAKGMSKIARAGRSSYEVPDSTPIVPKRYGNTPAPKKPGQR